MIDSAYALPSGPPADGDELASTLGWHSWCNWILARAGEYPESAHLACFGWADQFDSLDHELLAVIHECDDPDIQAVTAQVLAAVRARPDDAAALIATDGEPAEEGGDTQESVDIFREEGEPPFPGAVFDRTKHRWMKPDGSEPTPQVKPGASTDNPAPDHPTAKGLLARIQKSNLPPETKAKYTAAITSVTAQMPQAALDRIRKHLKQVAFHPNTRAIGTALADTVANDPSATPQQKAEAERLRGRNIGGAYVGQQFGQLHLDGDYEHKNPQSGRHGVGSVMTTEGVHAHEMTHAVDGPEHEISASPEWKDAFASEIDQTEYERDNHVEPRLTYYAASKPSEGLAEFGRLVYGSDVSHAQIEKEFPKATAVFKARGLWPEKEREGPESKMPEQFDERIPLPGGDAASHADTLKSGWANLYAAGGEEAAQAEADGKAKSLASRIAAVPKAIAVRVGTWLKAKHDKLAARYGSKGAKAVLAAMVLLSPTPIPGSSLIPIALAEAALRISRAIKGTPTPAAEATEEQLSPEQVERIARQLLAELNEEAK